MNRGRAALLSLSVAASAVAGLAAVHNSLALGDSAHQTTAAQVARRSAQLDRYQASLIATLAKKPPALPRLTVSVTSTALPTPVRVLYQRAPSPVVAGDGGDDEGESDDD